MKILPSLASLAVVLAQKEIRGANGASGRG